MSEAIGFDFCLASCTTFEPASELVVEWANLEAASLLTKCLSLSSSFMMGSLFLFFWVSAGLEVFLAFFDFFLGEPAKSECLGFLSFILMSLFRITMLLLKVNV